MLQIALPQKGPARKYDAEKHATNHGIHCCNLHKVIGSNSLDKTDDEAICTCGGCPNVKSRDRKSLTMKDRWATISATVSWYRSLYENGFRFGR